MTAENRRIQVLVVSSDVSILHEIAWMLDAVGYEVQTSTDLDQAALWRRYSLADVVIVDGRELAEPTREVFGHESDRPYYRIFLYNTDKPTDFSAWFAAGAHDGLRTPVSRGELLSRIRSGARYVEFERRLQERSPFTQFAGMYSRRGFGRKLRKFRANDELALAQHSVLAVAIDWYDGIRRKSGESVAHKLVSKAARGIRRAAGENAISAYLGDGVFASLLLNQSLSSARCIAESLVKEFGSRESLPESIPGPTLTCAVTHWNLDSTADRLLNDALETLKLGGQSGGDRITVQGEFSKDVAAWQQEMSVGSPFANVVAQDIMEPFAVILDRDAACDQTFDTPRRESAPPCAYVDGGGQLVGIAGDAAARDEIVMPETIASDASFPEIYEAFTSRGCAELVVTAGGKPLGYITCDGFLSMIDPVDAESFAHTDKSVDELAFLMVPSMMHAPAADEVSA